MLVKSEGFCVPHAWMALSWERNARTVIDLSRLSFRSLSRFTNCRAADLPLSVRVKNRNSLGSLKVSVALMLSRIVPKVTLPMPTPPAGPVPARMILRTSCGSCCAITCATKPPNENPRRST
ncbi:Uncharacterised protein [Mycobacterium tuberculosis]|nr:Uncharacterised protein [Mycobacterium tuberculosis]